MRKQVFLLMVVSLCLMGCRMNQQERAEKLVEMYLEEEADDPGSIEILKVTVLDAKKELDANGEWVYRHYGSVTYRGRNRFGALVKEMVTVCFNEKVTQLVCWDCFGH